MSTTFSNVSSDTLKELVDFCAEHPVQDTDAARCLERLNSGPQAIIDWRERGLVGVLLDAVLGDNGVIPFEIVGLTNNRLTPQLVSDVLAELAMRAVKLGAKSNELAITTIWQPYRALIERVGYQHSYSDYDMVCHNSNWGADRPLPPGAVWYDAWPDWVHSYTEVLKTGFADVPGAFVPPVDEVIRYLQQSNICARILIKNGKGIGLLRYTKHNNYINAVVRAGDVKGQGVGQLIMDEARRHLTIDTDNDMPMTLSVVDTNTAAIKLYHRCNFHLERDVPVLIRHF